MKAIFKREFRSFFTSPIGYIFLAANIFLISIYFTAYNLSSAYPYFSYTLSSSVIIIFITIPILTMRVFSEERRNKTDQLVLTAPVTVGKIVIGKFLAVAAVIGIVIAVISLYPLAMSLYGTIPWGETYTSVLGFALYALAGASVGIFLSSITESQIIAAVLSFAFMFVSYFMQGICSLISTDGNLLTKILGVFDFVTPFDTFQNGSLDLTSVLYFVTVIVLMLFLTTQSIQKRRYSISVKNLKLGAYSTVSIVAAIAAAVLLNIVAGQIPSKYSVLDVTANKLYTISDETKEMLSTLDEDVKIYVYCKESSFDSTTQELLKRYEGASDHISIEYVNPTMYPTFCSTYTSSQVSSGSLIIVNGDKSRVVDYSDLYETEYSFDYTTYSYDTETTGYDAEGQITSAIAYVTGDDMPTVYYTSGHGEAELDTLLTDAIEKSNMAYEQITLLTDGDIPEDCQILLINEPENDFSEEDCTKVKEYLEKGGKVMLNLYYSEETFTNLDALLSSYGMNLTNSLVIEGDSNSYVSVPYYIIPTVASDDMTDDVYNTYYVFTPMAMGMTVSSETADNVTVTSLLTTSSESYAKTLSADSQMATYEKEEGDAEGPFVIMARAEITGDDDATGTLLVNTSGLTFTESADQIVSGGNSKLFSGVLSNMADLELTVSIPSKSMEVTYLTISDARVGLWRFVTLFAIPVVLVAAGITVWALRRKK